MRRRPALTFVFVALVSAPLVGQLAESRPTPSKTWSPPRTPDGHPDFQGTWTHGTLTPFERPVALGEKTFYNPQELAEVERQAVARRAAARTPTPGDVGTDNEAFVDSGYRFMPNGQTSLVVEPANGRIPFREDIDAKRAFNLESRDDYESMSPWDRCITRSPTLMFPSGYNNGIEIVQTPGYVAIHFEMIHEARVIPIAGSAPAGAPPSKRGTPEADQPSPPAGKVRSWTGVPRRRWEGDTLVVDSTGFRAGWISTHAGSGRLRGTPNSEALHLVERFRLIDRDTIAYDVTIEDPKAFTQPWKVSVLLHRSDDYLVYEYACHEGNQAIELVLRGARAEEKAAASNVSPSR
jgi:hypothetical protein